MNEFQKQTILSTVLQRGVLMTTHVRFWRAHKKLKAEDVGLVGDKIDDRLISLGHKKLVPKEVLERFSLIESRVGGLVMANSFDFMSGVGRYVPNKALRDVVTGLQALQKAFWEEFEGFRAEYPKLRREAKAEWLAMAKDISSEPLKLMEAIEESYPTDADLKKYFKFEYHVFQVALPEEVDPQLLIDESDEVQEARANAAKEARSQILNGVSGFVTSCVTQMRQDLAGLVVEMQKSMAGGKTNGVHQKTLNRLSTFIDQYRKLNFAQDVQLERELTAFQDRFLTRTAADYRDDATAQTDLVTGLTQLKQAASALIEEGGESVLAGFGEMGGGRRLQLGKPVTASQAEPAGELVGAR